MGEYFWQKSVRADLKKELPFLKRVIENPDYICQIRLLKRRKH